MPATFPSHSPPLILLNQQKFLYVLYLSFYQKPLSNIRNTKRKSKAKFVNLSFKILFSSERDFHHRGLFRLWSSTFQMGAAEAREEVKWEGIQNCIREFPASNLCTGLDYPEVCTLTRGDIFYTLTTAAEDWCWFVQRQPQKITRLCLSLLTLNIPSLIVCQYHAWGFPSLKAGKSWIPTH